MTQTYDISSLCLSCGLCCNGTLHTHTIVKPGNIEETLSLGLVVEALKDGSGFRQPCRLYVARRCSAYPNHPGVCRDYRCDLLKKYLAGALSREQGAEIIQRTRRLCDELAMNLPPGYSLEQLRSEMVQDWDSGRGVFGSAEMRRLNAGLLMNMAKLTMYLRRHFCSDRQRSVRQPSPASERHGAGG